MCEFYFLLSSNRFRQLLQSFLELQGEFLVAFLADRLHVKLHKLVLESELGVAGGAGEAVDTPGLVQGRHHISFNYTVAVIANVSKQLIVVGLAVGQALAFIVAVSQERFFTLSTNKMLHVPLFAHGVDHTALDGSPAGSADRDTHLIVTGQTVQLALQLTGVSSQLLPAVGAVEVVRVVRVVLKKQWSFINNGVTLLTDVFPQAPGFLPVVAWTTQVSASIFDKPHVCENSLADVAAETVRVPAVVHGFDHSANDELSTLMTAGRKEHLEIMFAVFSSLELVEESLGELLETLGAHEALLVVQLAVTVDDLLGRSEATFTALTHGVGQSVGHVKFSVKITKLLINFHIAFPSL